jgi:hypothetical protein
MGQVVSAATITWQSAQNITGDSDVLTTGSLVYAYNFGPSGVPSTTVNTVTFTPFPVIDFSDPATQGNVTISESPGFLVGSSPFGGTASPFTALSASYQNLLKDGVTATLPTAITLQMGGLTNGQAYDFQWWTNASSSGSSPWGVTTGSAGNQIALSANTTGAGVNGGVGQFAIGRFTASGTAQSILFTGPDFEGADLPLINAFQLRAAAAPGPNSLIWNTTTGTWNTTNTVWTTGTGGTLAFANGDSVTFSGTGGGIVTISGSMQPSSITVSATSGTYTFVSSAGNLLTGTTGLAKSGGGTLILSGSTAFTGSTAVTGGSLLVNGELSSTTTTVSGGLLGGSGTVSGAVQMSTGGAIAPGAAVGSRGTLALDNLTGTGYSIAMDISGTGAGQYDRLVTNGSLDYTGVTLQLQMSGTGYAAGTTFDLLDAVTVSGTLATISMAGSSDGWQSLSWYAPGATGAGLYDYGAGVWQSDWTVVGGESRKLIFSQFNGTITVVPEPSTFVIAAAGVAALAFMRRRRRAASVKVEVPKSPERWS